MHRIDVPSASTSLPAPRAYGTPSYFQEGNPLTGVDATIVDEDWTNAVQEELVAIVLAAGMSLDKTNRAQVLAAIRSLISASHGVGQYSVRHGDQCRGDELVALTTARPGEGIDPSRGTGRA